MNGETKPIIATATKLNKIAELSSKNPMMELKCLMPHINKESLAGCFRALDGQKAVGIDGITKEMYGKNLEVNIDKLLDKMKSMSYRPQAAREVLIPKDGQPGETRPLAISAFEDKLVQLQVAKILEAIYEPIFKSCSYGFRPGRSCHTAIKDLFSYLNSKVCEIVIDVDLKNFFGMINHEMLLNFLRLKIKDERFIRYVARILKSGIFKESGFIISDQGAGQGSNCSPILSNIYAHYVLDVWLEEVVPNHITGKIKSFRYADDQVICCSNKNDAIKVLEALKGRLSKFGLQLNDKKTKSIEFDKRRFPRTKPGTFDYLGFTFYIRRSRKGPTHVAVKTSKVRLCSKLRNVKHWCKTSRSKCKLRPLWDEFRTKLRGHIQYYGVSLNLDGVTEFVHQATHTFFKWINRRSQRKSMSWEQFNMFLKAFPAPAVKICHHLF